MRKISGSKSISSIRQPTSEWIHVGAWGVFDYWRWRAQNSCRGEKRIFDRGVQTLLHNLVRFDTGYWSSTNNPAPA